MAPVLVGPSRGRGRDLAAALRPGLVEEKLANIAEPASGDLELAVIYPGVHLKVRAGGSPQPFFLSSLGGYFKRRLIKLDGDAAAIQNSCYLASV